MIAICHLTYGQKKQFINNKGTRLVNDEVKLLNQELGVEYPCLRCSYLK